MTSYLRLADGPATPEGASIPKPRIDPSELLGIWSSSDAGTRGIARVVLALRDGKLAARVFGAGDGGTIDWGEATITGVYSDGVASSRGAGFTARYDFGSMECHLQAQVKLGVLVLGTFTAFRDGGRRDYFSREFLALDPADPAGDHGTVKAAGGLRRLQDLDFGTRAERGAVDPAAIVGRWRNASAGARGLAEIVIERREEHLGLRVRGVGEDGHVDWGEIRAEAFACVEEDARPSACALATYRFEPMTAEFQIRQNKGVLAVTGFNRFRDDGGRADYVTRELFHGTR